MYLDNQTTSKHMPGKSICDFSWQLLSQTDTKVSGVGEVVYSVNLNQGEGKNTIKEANYIKAHSRQGGIMF